MRKIGAHFSTISPAEAVEWVQDFPDGPHFDYAISGMMTNLAKLTPETAIALASRINDTEIRKSSLEWIEVIQVPSEAR